MPLQKINGVDLFVEEFGSGPSLVLVHGSWVDHMEWPFIVPLLAKRFHVTIYDRRGHSLSERPAAQGSVREDVGDLAEIIERAGAPAHVVANSMGGSISLRLAAERPELIRTLAVHEPPLFGLLLEDPNTRAAAERLNDTFRAVADTIAAGEMEDGARRFVEMVVGPGTWEKMLPDEAKKMLVNNAPTFLDEIRDSEILTIDTKTLSRFEKPILISGGAESPPFFAAVLDRLESELPQAIRKTFEGAGHIPHFTHPQEYVDVITSYIDGVDS